MFALSADNSTCVNRTLQWRWLGTQKFSNTSVIDWQKKETARASMRKMVIVGGSAFILLGKLTRATHDIDALSVPKELYSLLGKYDIYQEYVERWRPCES